MSLSKLRAFGATFFIFSDYARPAIRLSALMELPTIFIFTHDAMGDGEDGPTHQPVEQLLSLRAIPGLVTLRPGDANEVVEAYRYVMQLRHQPAVLVLSRQPLPTLDRSRYAPASGVARGAYHTQYFNGVGGVDGIWIPRLRWAKAGDEFISCAGHLSTSFCEFQLAFPALYFACTSTGCRIELANAAFTMRPQGHMLPLDPMI
jgi:hypothetical protein